MAFSQFPVQDLEAQLSDALTRELQTRGLAYPRVEIELRHPSVGKDLGRKVRNDKTVHAPDDLDGLIVVARISQGTGIEQPTISQRPTRLADALLKALDRAEAENSFVALKRFRDVGDTLETIDLSLWKDTLAQLLSDKAICTYKVPNPRGPYETTAIRLDRSHAHVRRALATQPEGNSHPSRFKPRQIKGEPLSSTVLKGRR